MGTDGGLAPLVVRAHRAVLLPTLALKGNELIDSGATFHAQRVALELADMTDHTARTMLITRAMASYTDAESQAAFIITLPLAILAILDRTVTIAGERVQVNLGAATNSLRNGLKKKRGEK